MEEEIIIIVTRRQAQRLTESDANTLAETSQGLVRTFAGKDRFKKAAKFLRALAEVTED